MIETNKVYCMDAFELLKQLPDKSVDLVLIDPPYNIGKDEWDKIENYTEWFGSVLKEIERVLKENGSFYFWHNQFPIIAKIQGWIEQNTKFIFKSLITWEKYQTNKQYFGRTVLMGVNNTSKRNYFPMAEYCLFYTFQDNSYLGEEIVSKCVIPIRDYIRSEIIRAKGKIVLKEINKVLGTATNGGGVASACLSLDKTCPAMITEENYLKIRDWLNDRKEYEYLRKEYEDLRKEYEDLRFTFNNQKTHHSVWNYDIEKKIGHATPKPLDLIKNIILHSSKEGQVVLDCFMGSGTTALACKELNRRYIGFEKDPEYCKIISKRLSQQTLSNLSATPRTLPNGNSDKSEEFNMGDKVSATPTPKDASHPSHHPNIMPNSCVGLPSEVQL